METISELRQERHHPKAQPNRRCLQSPPRHKRRADTAPNGALNVRPSPKLTPAHKQALAKALEQGAQAHGVLNDLWTPSQVAALIHRQSQVRRHSGHIRRLLGQIGWRLQHPSRRAVQRDETAITRWKKHTWPVLKKGSLTFSVGKERWNWQSVGV